MDDLDNVEELSEKRNRSKKTSGLWDYFKDLGNDSAECLFCKKKFSYKTTTTNLRKHIFSRHSAPDITKNKTDPPKYLAQRLTRKQLRNAIDGLVNSCLDKSSEGEENLAICNVEAILKIDDTMSQSEDSGSPSPKSSEKAGIKVGNSHSTPRSGEKVPQILETVGLQVNKTPASSTVPSFQKRKLMSPPYQPEKKTCFPQAEKQTSFLQSQATVAVPKLTDEIDAIAFNVAHKLKKMDEEQMHYCERIINEALFRGALNLLDSESEISIRVPASSLAEVISHAPGSNRKLKEVHHVPSSKQKTKRVECQVPSSNSGRTELETSELDSVMSTTDFECNVSASKNTADEVFSDVSTSNSKRRKEKKSVPDLNIKNEDQAEVSEIDIAAIIGVTYPQISNNSTTK